MLPGLTAPCPRVVRLPVVQRRRVILQCQNTDAPERPQRGAGRLTLPLSFLLVRHTVRQVFIWRSFMQRQAISCNRAN